jgi:hypothetical protein
MQRRNALGPPLPVYLARPVSYWMGSAKRVVSIPPAAKRVAVCTAGEGPGQPQDSGNS